LMLGTRWYKF